jgi:hypothetical protein
MLTLSMFSFYRYSKEGLKKHLYLTFLWAGLGFLTKGPVALVIPVGVSFFYYASFRKWKEWFRAIFNPVGILIFLVVTGPWYTVQYMKEGQAFIDGFFLKHNVNRYVSTMEGHGGAFFYYLPMLMIILLPYSSLLLRTFGRIRAIFSSDPDRYLWFWFLFVLIFFSVSGTKLPHYILHGVPPLFILMARYSDLLRSRFWALLPPLLFVSLILFLPDAVRLIWDMVKDVYFKALIDDAWHVFGLEYRLTTGLILLCVFLLLFMKKFAADRLLIVSGYLLTFLAVHLIWPVVGEIQQQPVKNAAQFVQQKGIDPVMWSMDNPSFSVYRQEVTPWRKPENGEYAITRINKLKKLNAYEIIFKQGGVVIVHVRQTSD